MYTNTFISQKECTKSAAAALRTTHSCGRKKPVLSAAALLRSFTGDELNPNKITQQPDKNI